MGGVPLQPPEPTAQPEPTLPPPRPLRTLGRWLVGLLVVMTLVDAAAAIADIGQLRVLDRLIAGEDVPADEITAADNRFAVTGIAQSLVYFAIVVVWIVWLYRAYADVPLLGPAIGQRFGKGWAIGGWFVPILAWWRPKQITNDVWRASELHPDPKVPVQDRSVSFLLLAWWTAWVVVSVLSRRAFRVFLESETVEDQRGSTLRWLVSDAVSVPLDLLAIAVVLAITRRWEARRAWVLENPIPHTAPAPRISPPPSPPPAVRRPEDLGPGF